MKTEIAIFNDRRDHTKDSRFLLIGTIIAVVMTLLAFAAAANAQVASHQTTTVASASVPQQPAPMMVSDKPVARVNGVVLTDRDLLREMFTIFPYARQHNGFPKGQEAAIRQGALEMIIFEELVYQEAERRKIVIPAATIKKAEADFRSQFHSPDEYQQYLQSEMQGSEQKVRQLIKRSLLIEQVLKTDVEMRSAVTQAEVLAYYQKNGGRFQQPESFSFQSISVIPPLKPTPQQAKDAKKKADEYLVKAKATKSYQDFGLLAESVSEDDFRVNMGDHKVVPREKLPPQIVKAFLAMQSGQVSGLIPIESAYTIVRLNGHNPAHKQPFAEVKDNLKTELQKAKYEKMRSALAKQLRAKAKVEVV
jgi:parvulin-like peptidyl-prolyl isomerase